MPLPPVALLDPNCVWQPSMDDAARMVLEAADNRRKEIGGALYQDAQGRICYSIPVTGTKDSFAFVVDANAGKLVGIYHTHPKDGRPSENDVMVADKLKVSSYIRDKHGNITVYKPGTLPSGRPLGVKK